MDILLAILTDPIAMVAVIFLKGALIGLIAAGLIGDDL